MVDASDSVKFYCDPSMSLSCRAPNLFLEDLFLVWTQPLLLTLQLMTVSVAIAAVIGIGGAWAASTVEAAGRLGRVISRCFVASMVVAIALPMILHAAAWEATAGKFGWMIMTQTGSRADGSGAYGFFAGLLACGWIHGLIGGAMVALATWYGVRRTPLTVIHQSRLELGPIEAWWRVRLPIASPWWISALLATAILAATEMTVVDLYGYRSLADEFYLFYAVDPSLTSIFMTCCLPLSVAGVLLVWLLISRRRLLAVQSDVHPPIEHADQAGRQWRWLAGILAVALAGIVVLVPLAGLLVKLGHEVVVEDGRVLASWSTRACAERLLSAPTLFAEEYLWTAVIGGVCGLSALAIAWPMAAIGRTHRRIERWLDPATIVLVTIPGPIVGLVVVSLFQSNIPWFRLLYQQTIGPTVLALLVRAVPVAYWILRAGYRGIDTVLLEASRLDGTWFRRVWSVDRPLLWTNLVAASLAAAVVSSGDVPAMLPVIPPGVSTVGTRLFGLLHSGARYQEAALAIWYVAAIVVISLILVRQAVVRRVRVK